MNIILSIHATITSMDPNLLHLACSLYNTSSYRLTPLSGGHYNAVYQYPTSTGAAILRIGLEDCPFEQTRAMLDWVNYLVQHRAPVSVPVLSVQGNLQESLEFAGSRYTLTAFEKANGILAENIPPPEWTPDLYRSIGQAVGCFHRISSSYQPAETSPARPQWFNSFEIIEAETKLEIRGDSAKEKLTRMIAELKQLPVSPSDFAIIHGDLHFANFIIQPDGMVTIIDFDDCSFGWFAIDVAMALFDVLVLFDPANDTQAQEFSQEFLSNYLKGYRKEFQFSAYWQSQLPRFLKLKELCIYADLVDHPDASCLGTWVGNFMRGRTERIANNLPYVDINFMDL